MPIITMPPPSENELERLLKLAVTEPAHRPAFFRELLDATVLILGDSEQVQQDGDIALNADTPVNIQHWEKQDGGSIIPFFTSLEALQKAVEDEQPFIAMPARVLFEITQGADLFLNPKAEYGKEFYPEEVAMLLATGGVVKPVEHYVDKETQILLGQPEEYPSAMVDALTTLFSQRKPVRRAFLALMHDQAADEKPNLLIGLEVDAEPAEIEALINEGRQRRQRNGAERRTGGFLPGVGERARHQPLSDLPIRSRFISAAGAAGCAI